ncbi:hypothetical protein HK102_009661 [Quaeritorhiza haematococci]|nr:hypothetical protein HK102_009661 [Quaeritorhiza haematococci]
MHDDELDDEENDVEPTSIPQALEDLLRNVGSKILTLSLKIYNLPTPIAERLLPKIRKCCPRIRKLHIRDDATTTIKESDVEQFFKQCKKLIFIKHDAPCNSFKAGLWHRSGAPEDHGM